MSGAPGYVLGSDEAEIARLDGQATAIALPTRLLLQIAGIGPGMRVLDVGTGLGHVAFALAELVGPEGSVLGIDQDERLLGIAESRRAVANVAFAPADVRSFRDPAPFDAIVARLLLQHLPDAAAVLPRLLESLRPGGLLVAIDYDSGTVRAEPPVALVATVIDWIERAFRSAGSDPRVGARLAPMFRAAGVEDVTTMGIEGYLQPETGHGAALLAGVARSLAPQIVAQGIASEQELGAASLEERMRQQVAAAGAVVLAPGLVGAWGRRPDAR
jgi:protein-L-isoaspartate O-methyltransferase